MPTVQKRLVCKGKYKAKHFSTDMMTRRDDEYWEQKWNIVLPILQFVHMSRLTWSLVKNCIKNRKQPVHKTPETVKVYQQFCKWWKNNCIQRNLTVSFFVDLMVLKPNLFGEWSDFYANKIMSQWITLHSNQPEREVNLRHHNFSFNIHLISKLCFHILRNICCHWLTAVPGR